MEHHVPHDAGEHQTWLGRVRRVGTKAVSVMIIGASLPLTSPDTTNAIWQEGTRIVRNYQYEQALAHAASTSERSDIIAAEVRERVAEVANQFTGDAVRIVVASDTHCKIAAGDVVQSLVDGAGASYVIVPGDLTNYGSEAESTSYPSCIPIAPNGAVSFAVNGNHDSGIVLSMLQNKGWNTSRATIVPPIYAGDTSLAVSLVDDPRAGDKGALRQPEKPLIPPNYRETTTDMLCEQQPSVIVTHDGRLLDTERLGECIDSPILISGHTHQHELSDQSGVWHLNADNVSGASPEMMQSFPSEPSTYYILTLDNDGEPSQMLRVEIAEGGEINLIGPSAVRPELFNPATNSQPGVPR